MLQYLSNALGMVLRFCFFLVPSYGIAIILFTLVTKIILLPLSLWVHKNGIKVVRLQPELNHLKAVYFGDPDQIADKTAELYKREKYNPFASIIPLIVQLALLIGLVGVIYTPFNNILPLSQTHIDQLVGTTVMVTGADPESSSIQLKAIEAVQSGKYQEEFSDIPENVLNKIQNINLSFLGLDLAATPAQAGGILLLMPLLAGFAALLLSLIQNKLNPLQAEQSAAGKFGTTAFSVGLSLFLGAFVPAGVGFYWIWSNLFTIVQQYLLNWMIDPKKAIDYDALEKSKQELAGLQSVGGKKKWFTHDPNARREKADYKRFFSIANKHLVFYSEKSGFYKYLENVIEYLLDHSNVIIHYITSDPNDAIFEKAKAQPKIKPYYIGEKKLITLMMKMDADIVVMTMPELNNFHIKRSYLRKDTEYIYMFHALVSTQMIYRKGAFDNYDTIFCCGSHHIKELRETEKIYSLPSKKLIEFGYPLLDNLQDQYAKHCRKPDAFQILIAPSHHVGNIMDSCLTEVITQLRGKGCTIVVRPHPQYVKHNPEKIAKLQEQYTQSSDIKIESDFTTNTSQFESDVMITDWSGISMEYSFTTKKPCVFINTPMKVLNPEYQKISSAPIEIALRDKIGISVDMDSLGTLPDIVDGIRNKSMLTKEEIDSITKESVFNLGSYGMVGARYITDRIIEKQKQRRSQDQ